MTARCMAEGCRKRVTENGRCGIHQGYIPAPWQRRTRKSKTWVQPEPKLLRSTRPREMARERDAWLRQEARFREMLVERGRDPVWIQWVIDRERDHYQASWDWAYEA